LYCCADTRCHLCRYNALLIKVTKPQKSFKCL
jgi:hypothetical protein